MFFKTLLVPAVLVAGLAGAANAADLIIDDVAVAPAAATSNWDGFYIGIFGGYSSGTLTTTDNKVISPYEEDYDGYMLGVQAGYNFHLTDDVIGGFAADIAYNGAETEDPSYVTSFGFSGSATARLGLDLGPIMPYALAGISFASAEIADYPGVTESNLHIGYTAGVGVAAMVTDSVSINAEYRYTNFGTQIYDLTNVTTGEFADHSIRGGLNLHFN